jgi:flavodoxin
MVKLKEKLAEEWVHSDQSEITDTFCSHSESFIAGFEKARAIAAEIVEPYDCDIQEEMKEMGEEEVE